MDPDGTLAVVPDQPPDQLADIQARPLGEGHGTGCGSRRPERWHGAARPDLKAASNANPPSIVDTLQQVATFVQELVLSSRPKAGPEIVDNPLVDIPSTTW